MIPIIFHAHHMAQPLPSGSCDLTVLFNIECFLDCTQSAVYCALQVDCQKESLLKKPLTWLSVFVGLWLSMMKPLIDQVNHKFTLVLTVDNVPAKRSTNKSWTHRRLPDVFSKLALCSQHVFQQLPLRCSFRADSCLDPIPDSDLMNPYRLQRSN